MSGELLMRILVLAVLILSLTSVNGAAAARWSLGANLGVTWLSIPNHEDYTLVSAPSQGLGTVLGTPGIRIGLAPYDSRSEIFFDTGFMRISTSPSSATVLQFTGNYQYSLSKGSTHPYVTAGVGLSWLSNDQVFFYQNDDVAPMVGGGVGIRHRLHHGFGTLRAEARYDRFAAEDAVYFRESDMWALKLGFDMWGN